MLQALCVHHIDVRSCKKSEQIEITNVPATYVFRRQRNGEHPFQVHPELKLSSAFVRGAEMLTCPRTQMKLFVWGCLFSSGSLGNSILCHPFGAAKDRLDSNTGIFCLSREILLPLFVVCFWSKMPRNHVPDFPSGKTEAPFLALKLWSRPDMTLQDLIQLFQAR
jgi:hypothetical protein